MLIMEFKTLTDENFVLYAAKNYDNPQCMGTIEFKDDLARFTYLKRLISRYHVGGKLRERLILNHIIVIRNVFGIEISKRMLFFKMEIELQPYLKTFILYLNYMDEFEYEDIEPTLEIEEVIKEL